MRTVAIRNASVAASSARATARPIPRACFHAQARVAPLTSRAAFRTYATEAGPANPAAGQGLVLGALGLIAVGGYVYLKPIRDVAAKVNSTLETAKETVDAATAKAKNVASTAADTAGAAADKAKDVAESAGIDVPANAPDAMDGLLKALLPGGAYMIYNQFSGTLKSGNWGGLLSNLQDADIQGSLDQLKQLGGEDVKRVVEKVQTALDKADGKVQNVDWKKLSQDLSKELPKEYKQWVDFLVGKVPDMDDFNKYVDDAKKLSKEKLQDLNDAADKVYKKVEKASKDGKSVGDAFVEGVRESAPEDINKFVESLKKTAKDAGLPADAIESWARSQAIDSIDSAEEWAKDIESKVNLAVKWIPVEPETVVTQVSAVSPSLGKILGELIKNAKEKGEEGKKVAEESADKAKKALKK